MSISLMKGVSLIGKLGLALVFPDMRLEYTNRNFEKASQSLVIRSKRFSAAHSITCYNINDCELYARSFYIFIKQNYHF